LLTAVNTARSASGVVVVSMSWGSDGYTYAPSYDSYFYTPGGHNGVTFVSSAGDNGSPGGYPAYSPNVVAVGGTSLSLSGGNYAGESVWHDSSGATGGGFSSGYMRPSYQNGIVNSSYRGMPDVAFDAAPSTGVSVYSVPYGGWAAFGGTSLSAPCWAGLIALTDQARGAIGLGSLDSQTTLSRLYSLPAGDFHDITSGSNGTYSATVGWDAVTGRGTPIANKLVIDLAGTASNGTSTAYQVVDFAGSGVYRYSDATGWQRLNTADANSVAVDANGTVVASMPYYGTWLYKDSTGWVQLTPSVATQVAISNGIVVGNFTGYGVQRYIDGSGAWQRLNTGDANSVSIESDGTIVASMPYYGVWRFTDATGWVQLCSSVATQVSIGNGVIAGSFTGYGVQRYTDATGWQPLGTADATSVAVDAHGTIIAEMPNYGIWEFTTGWTQLAGDAAKATIGNDGVVLADFTGYGIYRYLDNYGWSRLYAADAYLLGVA
jgi:hypothetical protein